ncbi:MAG: PDZ domain-containing protein [Leptonema sp. (in: bacteria)]
MKLFILFFIFDFFTFFKSKENLETITKSVVQIEVFSFRYSYESPWLSPSIQSSSGTGFIVEFKNQKKILTNAHVVSNAFQIRVKGAGQSKYYFAKIDFIAHDCDLALLDIQDTDDFFKDSVPLEFGDLPKLNTPVMVIGFPIGGDKISITKGIVSRIDMDTYSHSGIDSHLVIQVDAAINPGNSGGPAIYNNKVIGVAFQILRSGENLGYLIPPPVIRKFFKDIQDGTYDGYIELGVLYQTLENPMFKKALNLSEKLKSIGVYVYDVMPDTTAEGYIQKGDILLEIQGFPITDTGEVFIDGEYRNFVEIIDNLEVGETIKIKILRNRKILNLELKAKPTKFLDFQRKSYDGPPEFFVFYGMVFQPLSNDLVSTYSSIWLNNNRSDILFYYSYALQNRTSINQSQKIIFTKLLPNESNHYFKDFLHFIVKSVNQKKIKNLKEFYEIIQEESKKGIVLIEFEGIEKKLVIKSDLIQKLNETILKNFSISKDHYIKGWKNEN